MKNKNRRDEGVEYLYLLIAIIFLLTYIFTHEDMHSNTIKWFKDILAII